MSDRLAQVRLRYRPASDVLSGEIELSTFAADQPIVDEVDADTYLEWRRCTVVDRPVLAAFQIVHASARPDGPPLDRLPAAVLALSRQLIATGTAALRPDATTFERLRVHADTETTLPVDQLAQPRAATVPATPATPAEESQAGALAAAIDEVASVIARLPEPTTVPRTRELVHLAHELASVLRETPGTTSPGTSAAARRAARQALPLDVSSRSQLWTALTQVDDRRTWQNAMAAFNTLAADLDRRPVDHPRRADRHRSRLDDGDEGTRDESSPGRG